MFLHYYGYLEEEYLVLLVTKMVCEGLGENFQKMGFGNSTDKTQFLVPPIIRFAINTQ
jgi:hypothetical protein